MYLSLRHKTEYQYYTIDSYLCEWRVYFAVPVALSGGFIKCHEKGQTGQLWGWYCPPGLTIDRKVFLRKKLGKKNPACENQLVALLLKTLIKPLVHPSVEKHNATTKLRLQAMQLECLNKKILIKYRWKEDGCPYQRTINSWKFLRSLCNFLLKFKSCILVIF